jgi:phytol kinase
MSPVLQVVLALASVAVLLGLMALVRRLADGYGMGPEVQRKMVHVGTGLYALSLPWLFPDRWPVYMLIALTLVVMLILRLPGSRLGTTLHSVERQSYGDLLLAISVGLCLFLAGDDLHLYVLPIAVLTLADAAAALTGSTYGRTFFRIEAGEKSVEGSAVFFVLTLLISIICLMLMTEFEPINIIVISLMVAGFGTLVEAASWRGFDNLFLPLGLLIFLWVHAANPLDELLMLAGLFALSILVFKAIFRRIGLSKHAAHVYVAAVFLVIAGASIQNAIIPILVLAAHAWSRISAPCEARFPDLDIVAGLALVSFGWLALGNATGWNAITFYGMTAMGMVMELSALAMMRHGVLIRVGFLLIVGLILCLLYAVALSVNPESTNWNGPMWPVVLACLLLAAGPPSLVPRAFSNARVTKVTLSALSLPLATYIVSLGRLA